MALSPTAAWTAAFASGSVEDRLQVEIYDGSNTWTAVSGECDQIDAPASIMRVDPISSEMDPLSRQTTTGQINIVVEDEWLRPILVANVLKHQRVTVTLGEKSLASGDFLDYFTGIISAVIPGEDKSGIVLECLDVLGILGERRVVGYWVGMHPLQIIEDILIKADVPTALYDATTLDPSTAAYTTANVSHFCVSRGTSQLLGGDKAVRDPTPAFELIRELAMLLNGQLIVSESGVLSFKLFDNSTATDFAFTSDNIIEFETIETSGSIINRYDLVYNRYGSNPGYLTNGEEAAYTMEDTDSQSTYAYPGETEKIMRLREKTPWLDSRCQLFGDISDSATTLEVIRNISGFSGMNMDGGNTFVSRPSWAKLSASRKIVLQIGNEIMTGTAWADPGLGTVDSFATEMLIRDPETYIDTNVGKVPVLAKITGLTRGAFGTTAVAHASETRVNDATLAEHKANATIERFGNGVHKVALTADIREFKTQPGDIGTIVDDTFVRNGKDGTDTGDKWECVGKELDDDIKQVKLTFVSAGTNTPTSTHKAGAILVRDIRQGTEEIGRSDGSSFAAAVGSGYVATASGLDVTIAEGTSISGNDVMRSGEITTTVPASKDTYIYKDLITGSTTSKTVTTGASPPDPLPGEHLVALAVAGAGSVTLQTEQVNRGTATVSTQSNEAPQSGSLVANGRFSQVRKG